MKCHCVGQSFQTNVRHRFWQTVEDPETLYDPDQWFSSVQDAKAHPSAPQSTTQDVLLSEILAVTSTLLNHDDDDGEEDEEPSLKSHITVVDENTQISIHFWRLSENSAKTGWKPAYSVFYFGF